MRLCNVMNLIAAHKETPNICLYTSNMELERSKIVKKIYIDETFKNYAISVLTVDLNN